MSKPMDLTEQLRDLPYSQKRMLLDGTLVSMQRMKQMNRPVPQELETDLKTYIFVEMESILRDLPQAPNYREKDQILSCATALLGIMKQFWSKTEDLPQEQLPKIRTFQDAVIKERYIEYALEELFYRDCIETEDIGQVLSMVEQTPDEYQKSVLYTGLDHFKDQLDKLSDDAAGEITEFMTGEIRRYLDCASLHEDQVRNLELLADICCVFADETLIGLLYEVAKLGYNHVNFYLTRTLLFHDAAVPADVVVALAQDMEYADMTYGVLKKFGKTDLFPQACRDPEYLAKSHMIQWLMYPTELGKAPEEIEYVGKVTRLFRKEEYHIFKYRSDSENLDEALKNKWLLGWVSEDGGTFSEFEEYAKFEMPTLKATLKNIKKHLLG